MVMSAAGSTDVLTHERIITTRTNSVGGATIQMTEYSNIYMCILLYIYIIIYIYIYIIDPSKIVLSYILDIM